VIEDIRLTEEQRKDIAKKYLYYNTSDGAVDEAANAATDKANKWWLEWLQNKLSYEMASRKGKVRHLVIEDDDWQALKQMVEEK